MESSGPFQIWGLIATLACFLGAQKVQPFMRLVCQPSADKLLTNSSDVYPLQHPELYSLIYLASIPRACRPNRILPSHLFILPHAPAPCSTRHLLPDSSSTHRQLPVAWKLSRWHPSPSLVLGMVDSYGGIMSDFPNSCFWGGRRHTSFPCRGLVKGGRALPYSTSRPLIVSPLSLSLFIWGEWVVEIASGLVLLKSSS